MGALTMEGFEKLNPFYKKKQNMSTKLTVMAGTYWGSRSCCSFSEVNAALEEKDKEILKLKKTLWTTRASMAKSEKERWESHVDCGNQRNRKDPSFVKKGKLLYVDEWRELWAKIERKCRAMAEKFGG